MSSAEPLPSDDNLRDLQPDIQGAVTFYHCRTSPGYWFTAGELEAMIEARAIIELPPRSQSMTIDEEFVLAPAICPNCGPGSHLFEMRSYLRASVRLRACHVCHGRWIGHQSLSRLLEHLEPYGWLGRIKRMVSSTLAQQRKPRPKADAE